MTEEGAPKGIVIAQGAARPKVWRWILPLAVLVLLTAITLVGRAVAPYLFNGATLVSEIASQVRATTGLALTTKIPGRFDLLPRPHIVLHRLHIADPTGTLSLDAQGLDGDVRLLPLVVGRVELSDMTLLKPHLAIDLDGGPMKADSLIGRAMHAAPATGEQRLGAVTLSEGTAVIRSRLLRRVQEIDTVNMTLDWQDLDSPATLTGSLVLRKTTVDVSAWTAQPASLMRGDHSAVAFHMHSAPLDLSANGDLVSAATTAFRGQLTATAPSILALLDLLGEDAALLAPFTNVSIASDAAIGIDPKTLTSIDLQNLKLRADGNDYEGTLALQTGERPMLSGTLATEQLMLAPFLHRMPDLYEANHRWSSAPILSRDPQPLDLDLRVSATHMRLTPFTIDDAALSIMTRGDRTEVALVEGKAYGGAVKGRFSVGAGKEGIELRGAGSIAGADASSLTWDASGRQLAAGTLSGSADLETSGNSPAALMQDLRGWVKTSVADGAMSGVDLGRAIREAQRNKPQAVLAALRSGRTSFNVLTLGARLADGIATIDDGTIQGPDASLTVTGSANIGARGLDIRAIATPPGASAASPAAPALGVDVIGTFDKPQVRPSFGTGAPASPSSASPLQ